MQQAIAADLRVSLMGHHVRNPQRVKGEAAEGILAGVLDEVGIPMLSAPADHRPSVDHVHLAADHHTWSQKSGTIFPQQVRGERRRASLRLSGGRVSRILDNKGLRRDRGLLAAAVAYLAEHEADSYLCLPAFDEDWLTDEGAPVGKYDAKVYHFFAFPASLLQAVWSVADWRMPVKEGKLRWVLPYNPATGISAWIEGNPLNQLWVRIDLDRLPRPMRLDIPGGLTYEQVGVEEAAARAARAAGPPLPGL